MRKQFPYLWSHLRPFYPAFLGIGIVLFAQMFATVLLPLPMKFIFNELVPATASTSHQVVIWNINFGQFTGQEALLYLSLASLMVGLFLVALQWCEQVWVGNISFRLNEVLRRELVARIFTRRQAYLDSRRKVDLLGRVSGDVSNLESLLAAGGPMVVRDIPMILVLTVMMYLVNARMTIAFSLALPIFYFSGHYFTAWMRQASRQHRRSTVRLDESLYEALNSMAIVKSLRGEVKLEKQLLKKVEDLTDVSHQTLYSAQGLELSMGATQIFVQAGFIFLGTWAIFRGELGIGDLAQLQTYMSVLGKHINNINKFLSKYPKCAASMDRLEELDRDLNQYPEVSGDKKLEKGLGELAFQRVSFQHGDGRKIFDDFSFQFPRNKLIAVVGPSGIGKSTFSRLLNRLNDPDEGSVMLGGLNLREFRLTDLRSHVRVLSQETFLLSGTVRENLLLATNRDFTEAELNASLAAVNADSFVHALPDGIETVIGEGGRQLSGGQAKRIHLARAFLDVESDIILFDEPTTGLDTHSSQKVIDSVKELARSKSLVFWITHRMQEVFSADAVLFFSAGANPVLSSHDELYASNALYRALMEQGERESPAPKAAISDEIASVIDGDEAF